MNARVNTETDLKIESVIITIKSNLPNVALASSAMDPAQTNFSINLQELNLLILLFLKSCLLVEAIGPG